MLTFAGVPAVDTAQYNACPLDDLKVRILVRLYETGHIVAFVLQRKPHDDGIGNYAERHREDYVDARVCRHSGLQGQEYE